MIGDLVVPDFTAVSKRLEPTGALIGRRIAGDDDAREVSKAAPPRSLLKPVLGTGPLHKAPTLARSGGPGQPARGLLVRTARLGQPIRKAYRSYDPEDARQRRLGAMAAGSGLGGGTLLATGARQIKADTKTTRKTVLEARQGGLRERAAQSEYGRMAQRAGEIPIDRAALVRLKPAGRVAGGAALLGAAGALMSDRHKKPWR